MSISKLRRWCPEDQRYVLAEHEGPNNVLHLLLSVITLGLWLPVWIAIAVLDWFSPYRCPACGSKTRLTGPAN